MLREGGGGTRVWNLAPLAPRSRGRSCGWAVSRRLRLALRTDDSIPLARTAAEPKCLAVVFPGRDKAGSLFMVRSSKRQFVFQR